MKIMKKNKNDKITKLIIIIFFSFIYEYKYYLQYISFLDTESNLKIFIVTHKDFINYRHNPAYTIVADNKYQLKNKYNLSIIYADKGKLYKLRNCYSEMSKLYYIYELYKKGIIRSKYVGLNHYRRYFIFKDNIPNLDNIFKEYDIILNTPLFYKPGMKKHFCKFNSCRHYNEIIDIIKTIRPEYYKAAIKTMNLKRIFICNLFIMKKDDFLKFCEFIFDVLFEFDKRHNFTSDEDVLNYFKKIYNNSEDLYYQYRIQGFLSERLGNIFYYKNFKKIKIYSFGYF